MQAGIGAHPWAQSERVPWCGAARDDGDDGDCGRPTGAEGGGMWASDGGGVCC